MNWDDEKSIKSLQHKKSILAIVGAGTSGICAALEAEKVFSSQGTHSDTGIVLLETKQQPAEKIRVTGNGKCNLTNRKQSSFCYRTKKGYISSPYYQDGWDQEIISFMNSIGVLTHEKRDGYVYPRTDQASTVADALIKELKIKDIPVFYSCRVISCVKQKETGRFELVCARTDRKGNVLKGRTSFKIREKIIADRVIFATGGMVSPQYGCFGDGYAMAKSMGHSVVPLVPALCPLKTDDPWIHIAAGTRTQAMISLYQGDDLCAEEKGELQITDYGISGIPVFQMSRYVSFAQKDKKWSVTIDFFPEISMEEWEKECDRRLNAMQKEETLGEFFLGLVPDKIISWILAGKNLVREKKIANLASSQSKIREILCSIFQELRSMSISIVGTAGFDMAQVTAGGIPLREVTPNLESQKEDGLYFAGELLDVDGRCGGYNLTWAIHSGLLAGRSAAERLCQSKKKGKMNEGIPA